MAAKFHTPTGMPWLVTSVVLPISYGGVLNVRVSVVPDEGNVPGHVALWSVTNPAQITTTPTVQTIPAHVALQPDTSYWLMLEPAAFSGDDAYTYWYVSNPPFSGWQADVISYGWDGTWPAWWIQDSPDRPAFKLFGRPLNETVITDFATAVEIRFETAPGGWYVPQYSDDLSGETWYAIGLPIVGGGGVTSVFHSTIGVTSRIYRVVTE